MKKYALCIPLLRHQLLLFLLLVLTLHANLRFLLKSRRALKTDEHVPLVRSSTLHPLQCSLTFPIFSDRVLVLEGSLITNACRQLAGAI